MRRKIFTTLAFICLLVFTQTSVFAESVGISKGIMPDSPFYSVDLGLEKIQLIATSDQNEAAKLHLQFSAERLNELDYLTSQEDVSINNVITVSDDYHDNIKQFNKIVVNQVEQQDHLNETIKPQLDVLQQTQNQIVAKINQSEQQEVKIIVKTAIKESQEALITAVETVKKPIEDKLPDSGSNPDLSSDSNNGKIVDELDQTIDNLKNQKEQLTQEILADEIELKDAHKNDDQVINSETNENIVESTNADGQEVNEVVEPTEIIQTWYYSPSCDYLSKTPGKDPVCDEDMIPIDSLPNDNPFFSKYTYDTTSNKYTQKLQDVINTINQQQEISPDKKDVELNQIVENEPIEQPEIIVDTTVSLSEF